MRARGELAAWCVAHVVARLTGEVMDPATINPYRVEDAGRSEALRRVEEYQARVMWRTMFGPKGANADHREHPG